MNTFNRLEKIKTGATILLKHFRSPDEQLSLQAAERFRQLPFLEHKTAEEILSDKDFFRLKHAYMVIAIEKGHDNWASLREQTIREDCMYTPACSAYLNVWFAGYDEAKAYQQEHGGYLLSYRSQFYICSEEVITAMGLDKFDAEWEAIGYDWVKPQDADAYKRIYKQAKEHYLKSKPVQKYVRKNTRPEWLNLSA